MKFNRGFIDYYRLHYPDGAEVELTKTPDRYRDMPAGLKGIILMVDDACLVHCIWENGNSTALIPGFDEFRAVKERERSFANDYVRQRFDAELEDELEL